MRALDRRARVYQVNHYLRRLGLLPRPAASGGSALRDRVKSGALGLLSNRSAATPDESTYSGLNRLRALSSPLARVRRALSSRSH